MHLLVRETRSLDETEEAVDLGQSPADIVFLSFSDSDLGAMAAAWQALPEKRPALRLANLAQLRHPMSVDLYLDRVVAQSRCVIVRLLGGLDYWRYGTEEIAALCARAAIPLALLPGDAREDARLASLSTITNDARARLDAYLRHGGPANMTAALLFGAHLAGRGDDPGVAARALPEFGVHAEGLRERPDASLAVIVFYRAYLMAGDMAAIDTLADTLHVRGFAVRLIFVGSLKHAPTAAFVERTLRDWRPAVVLNATGFSARRDDGGSPLDAADAPVLQVTLAGTSRAAWEASARGLSQADLAMQVVLPELDGRLAAAAISFKEPELALPELEFSRVTHRPDADGIALTVDRAVGWARLARTPRDARKLAIVLSDYPGAAGQAAHAVGLDTIASLGAIHAMLRDAGYDVGAAAPAAAALCEAAPRPMLSLDEYRRQFALLPEEGQARVTAAWGAPEDDEAVADGWFVLRYAHAGQSVIAIQPDRGNALDRKATYHDPDLPPRHSYVAFHLWLRAILDVHAVLHLGAHGTLEWLPGKAVAPSRACFPSALLRGLPVIYPFIVNNPGEAAAAKRRLGAVMIGHLTPPIAAAGLHGATAELERLIDEYASADGLDRRRAALMRGAILERARATGLLAESGVRNDTPDDAALARLDAYLCDVKDMQIRDGLHVFGRAPEPERLASLLGTMRSACPGVPEALLRIRLTACADAERAALLTALDGRFVPPGPGGAPTRGRADVLPTGRNLFAVDPRSVPTRAAMLLAERSAAELLRRHMQDHGEWPRSIVLDLWGSATVRTGGEELGLALVLLGARPVWDEGSNRVTGIEIVPLAKLDRPRVDVTLRISGLFRDAFPMQLALLDSAVRAIAERDESEEWNPLAAERRRDAPIARIFGNAPGEYGTGAAALIDRGAWQARAELGAAYLQASGFAYGRDAEGTPDHAGFAARLAAADAFVHPQDHAETDLLDSPEYAAHEGGLAAAADSLGNRPALYHADTSRPDAPRIRALSEEVARAVRGRAANPRWIAGMMRHGYRGAAEIARSVEGLFGFAATVPHRFDAQFELLYTATLGDAEVDEFLRANNSAARAAMVAWFREAVARRLWHPRRNDFAADEAPR